MNNEKKKWRTRVILTVRTNGEDGRLLTISPGEYTLSEGDGARYQLSQNADSRTCVSLWHAELLLCAYMGQLEIHGVWP